MDYYDDKEKSNQECYNFPSIRDIWRKYKLLSVKRQHHHNNSNHNVSSHNNKIKPSNETHDEDFFKASHDKKQDDNFSNHMNGAKKLGHTGNGVEGLNKFNQKHGYNHDHNTCFKAIILLGASKKKQFPSKVSASDLPDDSRTQPVKKVPSRSRSFGTTPTLGRSWSINNGQSEPWAKTSYTSRTPSMNRTNSIGSRPVSFSGRSNGSFVNRSSSIGRTRSEEVTSTRKMNTCRSGPLIMFSNSSGMLKPPTLEQQLECTLEELCHGCVKHINVTRNVYTRNGQIIQEEEVLTVNIKPGWKAGTKITFQGSPKDEKPGEYPADVVFTITEKHHPLFRRNEDDLELEIEIALVDALAGCTLTIPLLGKGKMSMAIDDIIYPGYEKVLVGQGMPNQKNPQQRGDLKIKFQVEFPKTLKDEDRSEIFRILSG